MNDEMLIEVIKQHEVLRNLGSAHYRRQDIKDKIWKSIAEEMNSTADACKRRWKGLRDTYRTSKKKLNEPSGSGARNVKVWPLFHNMMFLDNFEVAKETTTSYTQLDVVEEVDLEEDIPQILDGSPMESIPSGASTPISEGAGKRRRPDFKTQISSTISSLSKNIAERHNDTISKFFEYIASKVRDANLSSNSRSEMELEICNIVLKYVTLLFVALLGAANCAGLLKTPKVYNALITTDENLIPSRAFPVIQPTIHGTGIATYPFTPINPYRFFNPQPQFIQYESQPNSIFKGFSQAFSLRPEQALIPPPQTQATSMQPASMPKLEEKSENVKEEQSAELQQSEPVKKDATENGETVPSSSPSPPSDQKSPVPLNQFGLPPNLVPIHSFPRGDLELSLQPFAYNHHPMIYDPYQQFPDQYLPPFGYYPPPDFGIHPNLIPKRFSQVTTTGPSASFTTENTVDDQTATENIKNAIESKNKDVPDVSLLTIPSGAKAS